MTTKMLTIFAFSFLTTNVFAQTTEEEYNYIIKGYKIQIESGLDMKKGYILKDIDSEALEFAGEGKREVSLKGLYKINTTKPVAVMLIYKRNSSGYIEYFCIPSADAPAYLWEKTLEQVNAHWSDQNAKAIYTTLIWSLMRFSAKK